MYEVFQPKMKDKESWLVIRRRTGDHTRAATVVRYTLARDNSTGLHPRCVSDRPTALNILEISSF